MIPIPWCNPNGTYSFSIERSNKEYSNCRAANGSLPRS